MTGRSGETVRHVVVAGRRVRVSVRPGEGVPLLICNGLGGRMEVFDPFVDALDPSIPVVRFDVPGLDGSQLPRRPYRLALLSRWLGSVLTELGYERFDVLGLSWGGALAQQVAAEHTNRCRRVVLASTSAGGAVLTGDARALAALASPGPLRRLWPGGSTAGALFGGAIRRDPGLARRVYLSKADVVGRGCLLQVAAVTGWTSLPFLGSVEQPVLILSGDDDPLTPLPHAHVLHAGLSNSELHVFHDGHLGLLVLVDELAPRVGEFLRR